jgi:CHAT domain
MWPLPKHLRAPREIPRPVLEVFHQIADAPVVEDLNHHYRAIAHELEIAGTECRRTIRRCGFRVTSGTTQFIDMEVGTDVPLGFGTTQRWIAADVATGRDLRVETANEPDAYRKLCRVWLENPLGRNQPFEIQVEAFAPVTEIDGFGCAGVKLRGLLQGVDEVDIRFDFLDAPLSLNSFELHASSIAFGAGRIAPATPKVGFAVAYHVHFARPRLSQLLFAWFRKPGQSVQRTLSPSERCPMRILFLAANANATKLLDLEEEIRSLEHELRGVRHAQAIEMHYGLAARPDDLLRLVREHEPNIIHFSGHGSSQGIEFRADDGGYHLVSGSSLKRFLESRGIDLVVLNACYSKAQADVIGSAVGALVGTTAAVGDEAARRFTVAFYRGLGIGLSIREAFRDGGDAVVLYDLEDVFHSSGDLDRKLLQPNPSS